MLQAQRPPAFHRTTLRESRGQEAGGVEEQPEARGSGEGAEVEDTKWVEGV